MRLRSGITDQSNPRPLNEPVPQYWDHEQKEWVRGYCAVEHLDGDPDNFHPDNLRTVHVQRRETDK